MIILLRIDKAILDTSGVICDNIARFGATERGLLSQNILGHIRNFVEYVAIKAFSNGADVNPNDYNLNVAALKDMQRHGNLRFLYRFHELLQKSVSHYTVDKDGSERLMLKYYEHLFKTKLYLKQAYNLDVLENIEDFPLDTDTELSDYYTKIAERIETPSRFSYAVTYNNNSTVVPFQVAYAVSIHKAQGLEYDSVKIVITNEVEERITHNIFYTAITRAKNKLKIYWSPETEKSVLEHLEVKNSNKDAHLLAQLFSIAMTN